MLELEKGLLEKRLETGGDTFTPGKPDGLPYLSRVLKAAEPSVVKGDADLLITPVQMVEKYNRAAIVAPPGAGKSEVLKHLALSANRDWLPVPVSLRQWTDGENEPEPLYKMMLKTASEYVPKLKPRAFEKQLKSGDVLLLLDGADEVKGDGERLEMMKNIRETSERFPGIKIVVTCRTSSYCHEMPGFTRFNLKPLESGQISLFLSRWFAESDPYRGEALIKRLQNDNDLSELAKTPLHLCVMASSWNGVEEGIDFPGRVRTINTIIDFLLETWEAGKGIRSRFSPAQKRVILRKLAYTTHSRHRRSMTEKEIVDVISSHALGVGLKPDEFMLLLKELWQRNGILVQLGPGMYEFFHLSLQEYFTALELSRRPGDVETLLSHIGEPNWRETIHFFAGMTGDATVLIKEILESDKDDIFYNRLMLAGRCLAESGSTNPKLRERIIHKLWDIYLMGEYPLLRSNAAGVLSRLKPPHVIKDLLDQLTDNDDGVRRAAAQTLGLIGGPEVLPPLIMLFVKEKENRIRCDAASALGHIAGHEAVATLVHALESEKKQQVRRCAAEALGISRSTEALPQLIKSMKSDKDYRVREGAAEALGELEHKDAIPHLVKQLKTEKSNSVRWRIVMALGKIGGDEARTVLIEALAKDDDRDVRNSAAEALGLIGGPQSIRSLIRTVRADDEPEVRGYSAYSLGQIGSEEAMPILIEALITDESLEVRGRAAFALGRIKKIDALPYLTAVFNSYQDSFIRGNATYAVGEIAGAEAIPFLVQALLLDKDPYVRFRAAEVLGDVGNTLTIPHLQTALKDTGTYFGWKVSDKAFEALDKISHRFQVTIYRTNPDQSPPHPQFAE